MDLDYPHLVTAYNGGRGTFLLPVVRVCLFRKDG